MTTELSASRVALLDAGGQYVDLVKKAVERQGIPTDILPLSTSRQAIEKDYQAVIISGSPVNTSSGSAPQPDEGLWDSPLPLLGICYGMQAMAKAHGGEIARNAIREDGRITTVVDITHPIFQGTKKNFTGLFTHGDFVRTVPHGFKVLGSHKLSDGTIAYSSIAKGNKIGVQFHPEVFDDTPLGYQVFQNFLFSIAGLKPDKSFKKNRMKEIIKTKREELKTMANGRPVIAFVSGGVDSSVAAALAAPILGDRMHAYYIDSGFMRYEDDRVVDSLLAIGLPVTKIEAAEEFEQASVNVDGKTYGPLIDTADPETKRKIIGKAFVDIQNRIVSELNVTEALLLQGTNAADRIESGHSKGDLHTMTIKTHHNQVREVRELKEAGLLIEPIDDLFKDEIREMGRELGLPEELVERQPFPGPGLAIRIIASSKDEADIPPMPAEVSIQTFLNAQNKGLKVHLLPIRSVGVGGDERSHLSVVAIEHQGDGWLDISQMANLGSDLPAHFRDEVNRVIYALGDKPLGKCTQTKTLLTATVREQLRQADKVVYEEMRKLNLLSKIAQFPVVLLPLSFGKPGQRSIVLRPIKTSTFMTAQAMLPERDLPKEFFETVTERILTEDPNISQVFLDLTNKPPATVEWE